MQPITQHINIKFQMHVRRWQPANATKQPVLLVHGLASNARTWDGVARRLAAAGHEVAAIDQRGHGLTDKLPLEGGYGFDVVTDDLRRLIAELGWIRPILIGQSWGANVLLSFAARHPTIAAGYVWVDGGFFHLKLRGDWATVRQELAPPPLAGTPLTHMRSWMERAHPDWPSEGIDGTLANFEHLPDGTVRPWLTLARHMAILHAMWEQDPPSLSHQVQEPVLICAAGSPNDGKAHMVNAAHERLPHSRVEWFENTDHDIHVQRPQQLVEVVQNWIPLLDEAAA